MAFQFPNYVLIALNALLCTWASLTFAIYYGVTTSTSSFTTPAVFGVSVLHIISTHLLFNWESIPNTPLQQKPPTHVLIALNAVFGTLISLTFASHNGVHVFTQTPVVVICMVHAICTMATSGQIRFG